MKIIEYKIHSGQETTVVPLVNESIRTGWQPYGPPYRIGSEYGNMVAQAVVLYGTPEVHKRKPIPLE